jgi:hypothetical protein
MDNPVGGEIHQKNDRFKKFDDVREARDSRIASLPAMNVPP